MEHAGYTDHTRPDYSTSSTRTMKLLYVICALYLPMVAADRGMDYARVMQIFQERTDEMEKKFQEKTDAFEKTISQLDGMFEKISELESTIEQYMESRFNNIHTRE